MKKILLLLIISLGVAYAGLPLVLVDPSTLSGFNAAIKTAEQQVKVPVIFPVAVPAAPAGAVYYVNADYNATGDYSYDIYIDTTPTCHGVHYCNVLTLNASTFGSPSVYKNMQHQVMTTTVVLNNGIQANYTQGFAMGDYFNPNIAWLQNGLFYSITWQGVTDPDQTRKAMTWMANNMQSF